MGVIKGRLNPLSSPPPKGEGNRYLCLLEYFLPYFIRHYIGNTAVFAQILGIDKTGIRILFLLLLNYFRDVPADMVAHKEKERNNDYLTAAGLSQFFQALA